MRKEFQAIYVMWLRQMKRSFRAKSRIVASIIQPLFFLVILGSGFRIATFEDVTGDYIYFLAPGIITMSIMFSSMFTGVSVLWDKQFGFLQEVLVAPVKRISIILGRTFGGATTALIQGFIILFVSIILGIDLPDFIGFILVLILMVLISFTAVGFGLIIATKMNDFQGFQLIMNLIIMPLLFLSSAFFPIGKSSPEWLRILSLANPLFYMVDGMRGSLTGENNIFPPMLNIGIVLLICLVMMGIGSYLFSQNEA
ncbi:MAG: ABC transporter permease [Thermoplasmatota archaeon]